MKCIDMAEQSIKMEAEVSVHYAGQRFFFRHSDSNDHIFQVLKNTGEFYEQEFLSSIRRFLHEGDNIVDVGANMGTHTVFFAGACKCNVFAFEPNPAAARLLKQNVEANGLTHQVEIREVALGAANGFGKVLLDKDHNLGTARIVDAADDSESSIQVATLSELIGDIRIRLIKIDVEGMDLDVLMGAEELIARDRPIITAEAAARSDFSRIFEVLERHGYLPFGSVNYTPTHIFVHADELASLPVWGAIQKQMSMDYIDRAALRDQIMDLRHRLARIPGEFSSGLDKLAHEVTGTGAATSQKLNASLTDAMSPVHSELGRAIKSLSEVEEKVGDANLRRLLDDSRSGIGEQFSQLRELYQNLEARVASIDPKIASSIEASSDVLSGRVGKQIADLGETMRASASTVPELLQARISELDRKISETGLLAVGLKEDVNANRAATTEISRSVSVSASALREMVEQQIAVLGETVRASANVVPKALQARISELDRKISGTIHLTTDLKEGFSANRSAIAEVAKSVEANRGQIASIPSLLQGAFTEISSSLANMSKSIDVLTEKVEGLALKTAAQEEGVRSRLSVLEGGLAGIALELSSITGAANRTDEAISMLRMEGRDLSRMLRGTFTEWQDSFSRLLEFAVDWMAASDLAQAAAEQDTALLRMELLSRFDRGIRVVDKALAPSAIGVGPESVESNPPALKTGPAAKTPPATVAVSMPNSIVSGDVWRVVRPGQRKPDSAIPASVFAAVEQGGTLSPASPTGSAVVERETGQVVAVEEFSLDWHGKGWAQAKAVLDQGGVVRAASAGDAGIVTRQLDFPGGGLLEIEIEVSSLSRNGVHPVLRIVADEGDGIGHDAPLSIGVTKARAFAPERTHRLKLYISARNCRAGDSFTLQRLTVRRLDADTYQRAVYARIGEPVLASMASIPSRRGMLADCVNSLLVQCDRVRVFLNNYPDVPDFLKHPRVDIRRSQDWDDRGDAGKVFWLEQDKKPGYRLIVDDDLVFPPNFAEVMCGKVAAKDKKAIYATHGVLIRQPVINYYDNRSRAATFHFGRELLVDRSVHIGATNALCLHSEAISMRWADFKYCNSADIWLALHAREKGLQVLTPARPRNWVRENRHAAPDETIYKHSVNRTRTRFDSSLVQDAALKHGWPLTVNVGDKPKYGLLVNVSATDGLADRIEKLIARSSSEVEWVIVLAYDRSLPAREEAVAGVKIERETHLVDINSGANGLAQATALMARIGLNALLGLDGDALSPSDEGHQLTPGAQEVWLDKKIVKLKVGRGKDVAGVIVAGDGNIPEQMLRLVNGLSVGPSGLAGFTEALRNRKLQVAAPTAKMGEPTVNSVFKHVKVLNLDRRPDRWESVSRSLSLASIEAQRFSAVDGISPDVAAEYQRYSEQPKVAVSAEIPQIRYQRDLYMGYASQMARIAYLEREGKKAIASQGAWGYLKSYEAVLEEALAEGTESLLVFDDDVLLHKDTQALFAQAMKELPDDWLILQLGTLQYNWSLPWAEWHSPMLYRTNGSAVGSHAVGMRFDIFPYLLDHVRRFDMPYDIGALSAATRAFPDRCFVIYPNVAIQSMVDSDIGTSDFQKTKKREDVAATYKWRLDDYR